ncbi:hypothetical protein ACFYTS_10800 [Nocardia sp. NPDC004151]|uniref:hypothetical protein n=1 Tax=Nocardia sp. NPDC004151 TaxID=3364304 RepID=UPI0036A16487
MYEYEIRKVTAAIRATRSCLEPAPPLLFRRRILDRNTHRVYQSLILARDVTLTVNDAGIHTGAALSAIIAAGNALARPLGHPLVTRELYAAAAERATGTSVVPTDSYSPDTIELLQSITHLGGSIKTAAEHLAVHRDTPNDLGIALRATTNFVREFTRSYAALTQPST